MIETQTIIIILIIILIIVFTYHQCKSSIAEAYIINMIKNVKYGNFKIVDTTDNNNVLVLVINDETIPVPTLYIINKEKFFLSVYDRHEVGLGESYTNGDWKSDNLFLLLLMLQLNIDSSDAFTADKIDYSEKNIDNDKAYIKQHYDVGNDFYVTFLKDPLHAYSCGIWKDKNTTLSQAQYNKVNIIIDKMNVNPNSNILDIGCGWGKIAEYVADKTKSHVTGITVSDEQDKYSEESNMNKQVTILNKDYRMLDDTKYDAIYSIGMFEHVRYENYDDFFKTIKRILKPDGRLVLHTIIWTDSKPTISDKTFLTQHIFPHGQIPCTQWIIDAIRKNKLNIIHIEYFGGQHYARTLREWRKNMMLEQDYIVKNYGEVLIRKYDYYFSECEAAFALGNMGIGHFIITNNETVDLNDNYVKI